MGTSLAFHSLRALRRALLLLRDRARDRGGHLVVHVAAVASQLGDERVLARGFGSEGRSIQKMFIGQLKGDAIKC
eukprot:31475-Pelagococcus_subviridis.AAC.15